MKIVIECEPEDYEFALEAAKTIIKENPPANAVAVASFGGKFLYGSKSYKGNYKFTAEDDS